MNYKGYAWPSVLGGYQLGPITCTKDELQRDGSSAKHLQYLAYGLPVLVPAWRRQLELLRGSVTYDNGSFTDVIDTLRVPSAWQRLGDMAYERATALSWDRTVQPLDAILAGSPDAST